MANEKEPDRDLFTEVKEAFSRLELDQKATFLVTESVNTAVEAVSALADAVTRDFAQCFDTATTAAESATAEDEESDSPRDESA